MATQNNVFTLILENIEKMNETLAVVAVCLALCVEKLDAIETGVTGDTKKLEEELILLNEQTTKTLEEFRMILNSLKPKKKEKSQ